MKGKSVHLCGYIELKCHFDLFLNKWKFNVKQSLEIQAVILKGNVSNILTTTSYCFVFHRFVSQSSQWHIQMNADFSNPIIMAMHEAKSENQSCRSKASKNNKNGAYFDSRTSLNRCKIYLHRIDFYVFHFEQLFAVSL